MISPVSPQFVILIHKEKERELEREIELMRIARERRVSEADGSLGQRRTWYAQASQWMNEKLFNRASESKHASAQPETFTSPCTGVPC